ncbi:hypothetical protein QJS04_geneDACA012752 [Acorus gramineus]|uniref:Transposase n=1 Tax=Acorus gramineus TaxID=55184 RepID=A0AAV9A1M0_ACOGR|nr:hypothetical protein QJS04_geneDACA012752 [Acorus gramineus]
MIFSNEIFEPEISEFFWVSGAPHQNRPNIGVDLGLKSVCGAAFLWVGFVGQNGGERGPIKRKRV